MHLSSHIGTQMTCHTHTHTYTAAMQAAFQKVTNHSQTDKQMAQPSGEIRVSVCNPKALQHVDWREVLIF